MCKNVAFFKAYRIKICITPKFFCSKQYTRKVVIMKRTIYTNIHDCS